MRPWVDISDNQSRRPADLEATYWTKGGRTLVFVLKNASVMGSALGGGGAEGLKQEQKELTIEFPSEVEDAIDERRRVAGGDSLRLQQRRSGFSQLPRQAAAAGMIDRGP